MEIPDGVTNIGNYAFAYCRSINEVTVPGSVKKIGDNAFESTKVQKLTLGDGISTIGSNAFSGCPVTEVTIPESVTAIGDGAFSYTGLSSITLLPAAMPAIGENAFNVTGEDVTVYVHSALTEESKALEAFAGFTIESLPVSVRFPNIQECVSMQDGVLSNPGGLHITVYDTSGVVVYNGNAVSVQLPAGVYMVRSGKAARKVAF